MNVVIGPVGMAAHHNEGMEWMRVRGGYPVVDGAAFAEVARQSPSEQTIHDAIDLWLEALRESLGETYEIVDSDRFVAIAEGAAGDIDALLVRMEVLAVRLSSRLHGIAALGWRRRPLVLLFDSAHRFNDYFTAVDEGDGERPGNGCRYLIGRWLDQFLFAPAPLDTYEPAILHGLAHTMTVNLNHPYWVREMVAAYAADEPLRDFERDWSDEQVSAFRSGQSFFDDELREASFARVARLARKLSADYDAFVQFVRKADWNDQGEAAAREVFGTSVRDLLNR
jgi:hypothetical protein